ncbi:MAG TPA: lytic transglycosylase domain-containing protein [Candidatus Saccharimonadales bacterium]
MAENILDSYFIRIGSLVDQQSFAKGLVLLTRTEMKFNSMASTGVKALASLEFAGVSTFASIGAGLIALADKTAMTDQSYRLMGMRMLMTKDSARAMQTALDELGVTIDEVAFDPELNARFQYLYKQNIELGKQLGGDFDKVQRNIRDIRMEYKRFSTELDFLSYRVVSDLFEKLGFGNEDLLNKLNNINDWFVTQIPTWSEDITKYLVPAWDESKIVLKDSLSLLKQIGGEYSYISGILTDDSSIKSTEFSMENLAKATQDWIDLLAKAVVGLQMIAKAGGHDFIGITDFLKGIWDNSQGDYQGQLKLWSEGRQELRQSDKDVRSLWDSDEWKNNPDASGLSDLYSSLQSRFADNNFVSPSSLGGIVDSSAKKYGINPELVAAIIQNESGGNAGAKGRGSTAQGLMQLLKGTRDQYGVKNGFNPQENVMAGTHYLADLLVKYRFNVPEAIAAYRAGPGAVDRAGGLSPDAATTDYVSRVLRDFIKYSQASQGAGGHTIVGPVTITVPHSLPEGQWSDFVKRSFDEQTKKDNRNMQAQLAGGAHF